MNMNCSASEDLINVYHNLQKGIQASPHTFFQYLSSCTSRHSLLLSCQNSQNYRAKDWFDEQMGWEVKIEEKRITKKKFFLILLVKMDNYGYYLK